VSDIGIDLKVKTLNIDGKNVKMQVWDTAGQERFRTITQSYYKGSMGIMLLYDCTSEESFQNVRNWVRQIELHANPEVQKVLVGNKCDLEDKRVISKEMGEKLASDYNMKFIETSAKSGHNVGESFYLIAKELKDLLMKSSEDKTKPTGG
jgi:Ras-related protein Rab-8A